MEITEELVVDRLLPKAVKIWERKRDCVSLVTLHVLEAFSQEFDREPYYTECDQIEKICRRGHLCG